MRVRHWNTSLDGPFSEAAFGQKLESAGYLVVRSTHRSGTSVPEHRHATDTTDAVVSGRLRMIVAGHFVILGPGDWLEVPRGVHHSAAVVGDEPVVSLGGVRLDRVSSARD